MTTATQSTRYVVSRAHLLTHLSSISWACCRHADRQHVESRPHVATHTCTNPASDSAAVYAVTAYSSLSSFTGRREGQHIPGSNHRLGSNESFKQHWLQTTLAAHMYERGTSPKEETGAATNGSINCHETKSQLLFCALQACWWTTHTTQALSEMWQQ